MRSRFRFHPWRDDDWAVLAIVILLLGLFLALLTGCNARPQVQYTGGSVARVDVQQVTPVWSPPTTQKIVVTEGWFATTKPFNTGEPWHFVNTEVTYFPPQKSVATVATRQVATTQPSLATDDVKAHFTAPAIRADGGIGPTSLDAIPIPKPPSGVWGLAFAVICVAMGGACCYFGKWPVGLLLIGVGAFSTLVTPFMLTIILIVLAVVGTLVGVYYAYKHNVLQSAIAKIDRAAADLAVSQPSQSAGVLDAHLDAKDQALIPTAVAAAQVVKPVK